MSKKNKSLSETWEPTIKKMGKEELQHIISEQEIYQPEFIEMVKARLDELSSIPDHEVMKDIVKRILEELGCPYEVNEDGDIDFIFQGMEFSILLSENNHYIEIIDFCWKHVKLSDTDEVRRLKYAINKANTISDITTVYFENEEEEYIGVYCTTSILYRPIITNLKDYLRIRLSNFFLAHDLVNTEMILQAEREGIKQEESSPIIHHIDKQAN